MMRDILFRGKRSDNGAWVEGFFNEFANRNTGEQENFIQTVKQDGRIDIIRKVIPETVGQYTGLTDKNGKRIFEGDVVKISHKPKPYKVRYKSGCYCIGINWALSHEPDCEVIGNIYDNPELIGGDPV